MTAGYESRQALRNTEKTLRNTEVGSELAEVLGHKFLRQSTAQVRTTFMIVQKKEDLADKETY